MPRRNDINKILIIGSGPIVIGQACEFDYSGTQACKALKEDGYEVILVNSNPATIMTDPSMASKTFIEPITPEIVAKIIESERPDAILPTLGGQTALNVTIKLYESGVLDKFNVKMIGADYKAIKKAEDRQDFKEAMRRIGLDLPKSGIAYNMQEAVSITEEIGYPLIIRPSFTLGGTGGGIVFNEEEFIAIAGNGLKNSMISEILIEESVLGWKEYELEVMRDSRDNVIIICSIENLDPMGVHTGDSITVAPAQTLSDVEYQKMRDASIDIIREIGVDTGGSNIQFAVNPKDGRMVVIEMNPRVSRSSALASKATGFPIAKIAAKLAVGYSLDELRNDITKETPASFEPALDYCVVKVPRFNFEKFPEADSRLGVSMKSVGETMAIGRNFKEALQKALRGLEIGVSGLCLKKAKKCSEDALIDRLKTPNHERIFFIKEALERGFSPDKVNELTDIDPWFIENIRQITECEKLIKGSSIESVDADLLRYVKQMGFSDSQIAELTGSDEVTVRTVRKIRGVRAVFKLVDTCAAEFEAYTPYYYSTYDEEDEVRVSEKKKIMILGGGPNRIGQGIEFDYCCCQAAFALKEIGYETIMVNSNPETVSTDFDTSDKLYFEPLTFEDVMNVIDSEKPDGVIVQFGGQTPLNLARKLQKAGAHIIGTSVESIDRAEDRDQFSEMIEKLKINQAPNGIAESPEDAVRQAGKIGYPVLVRPSYVLGGRAMKIVYSDGDMETFMEEAVSASPEKSVLIDKFIEDAIEVDVDAVSDGENTYIGGIMEHIEYAGIHSGDSACALPPHTISDFVIKKIEENTVAIAGELQVIGLLNIQYAVKKKSVFVLEVNPRASRTVPFVSKATGVPLAKIAAKIMAGEKIPAELLSEKRVMEHFAVKESVLPFSRFSGVDIVLGPEMKSTGEVMGIDNDFSMAFAKSQLAAGVGLPLSGKIFISVADEDKRQIIFIAKKLFDMGFEIFATSGTAKVLKTNGIKTINVHKIGSSGENVLHIINAGNIKLVINTPSGKKSQSDIKPIRSAAAMQGIPCITTIQGAQAAVNAIEAMKMGNLSVMAIQDYLWRFSKK
ncbi:carbamoyl-phosphate synthase large subunit [bacterium]|nr:carbamoyl-phosphate synthase large subunit [bacterium]